jgi:hypothetical protein
MNMRKDKPSQPYDFRVDRASVIGNPFEMKDENQRNEVCDKYVVWFDEQIKEVRTGKNEKVKAYLSKLINAYREYGQLRLFCWCAPKRCHAETIKKYLLEVLQRMVSKST